MNFIFAKNFKRHICHVKKLQPRHDLPTLVNARVILPIHNGFVFTGCEVSQEENPRENF